MRDMVEGATLAIRGAKVILAGDVVEADVLIAGGMIAEVGSVSPADRDVDGRGLFLAPALVDVHGDAFERQMMPRPNTYFPLELAVLETDRQLAANGIATAYHAVTLSWEPGLRDVGRGRDLIHAMDRLAPRLNVENRVQLRWETFAFEAMDLIEETLKGRLTPSLAFNDHTSMTFRSFETKIQDRAFEQSPEFQVAAPDDPRLMQRIVGNARRAGLTPEDYHALLLKVWERRPEVDAAIRKMADAGRAIGAPMLSHDDTRAETRAYYRGIGATVSEFPMVMEAAEDARTNGDAIIFGSPNAARGGSHIGSLGAGDMVEAGMCDALASDYYYPAMLAAVARLEDEKRAARPALRSLVSSGPARMSGLDDRGTLEAGKRADLVLVDWPEGQMPAVRMTLSGGRVAYQAQPLG